MRAHCISGIATGLVVLLLGVDGIGAQSLDEIARREHQRRTQSTSTRVYTNADLVRSDRPASPAAAVPVPTVNQRSEAKGGTTDNAATTGEANTGEAQPLSEPVVKPREHRDERYWRSRSQDLRARLAKTNAEVERLEAALAEIDAAPVSPTTSRERAVIAAALARLRADAQARLDDLKRLEARARVDNVPSEWTQ